jgi:hypothetical protein
MVDGMTTKQAIALHKTGWRQLDNGKWYHRKGKTFADTDERVIEIAQRWLADGTTESMIKKKRWKWIPNEND